MDAVTKEWPTGRYRLTLKAYMPAAPGKFEAVHEEGTEVIYAGPPGDHMEPLDDAARSAVKRRDEERAAKRNPVPDAEVMQHAAAAEYQRPLTITPRPAAATTRQSDPEPSSVDIPDDWKTRSWPFRKSLAAQLTSDPVRDADDANDAIEAEIARRKNADI